MHFLYYGLIGWLALRAMEPGRERPPYLPALVLTGVIGLGDEAIQWVLPNRFFEWKDVGLNVLSAALALLAVRTLRGQDSR